MAKTLKKEYRQCSSPAAASSSAAATLPLRPPRPAAFGDAAWIGVREGHRRGQNFPWNFRRWRARAARPFFRSRGRRSFRPPPCLRPPPSSPPPPGRGGCGFRQATLAVVLGAAAVKVGAEATPLGAATLFCDFSGEPAPQRGSQRAPHCHQEKKNRKQNQNYNQILSQTVKKNQHYSHMFFYKKTQYN
jgi:hypothetical protein